MSGFLDKTGLSYLWEKVKTALSLKQDKLSAGDNITIDNNVISASAGEKNTFYGTCSTASNVQTKVVECSDWEDKEGNVLFVKFDNEPYQSGLNSIQIGDVKHSVYVGNTAFKTAYKWSAGEVVGFVLANNRFNLLAHQTASENDFGLVKITNIVANDGWGQTAAGITCVYRLQQTVNGKQDKLTAGTGITIADDGTISASGGSGATQKLYYVECESDLVSRTCPSSQCYIEEVKPGSREVVTDGRIRIYYDDLKLVLLGDVQQGMMLPLRVFVEGSTYGMAYENCVKAKVTLNVDAMTCTVKIVSQQFSAKTTDALNVGQIVYADEIVNEYKVTKLEALN